MAGTLYRCPAPGAPPFVKRLEFLGDSMLDILITWYLYQSHKELDPGELTDLRSASVNNEYFALATVRQNLHLHLQHCSGLLLSQIKEYAEFVSGSRSTTKSSQVAKRPKVKLVLFLDGNLKQHSHPYIPKESILEAPSLDGQVFEAVQQENGEMHETLMKHTQEVVDECTYFGRT